MEDSLRSIDSPARLRPSSPVSGSARATWSSFASHDLQPMNCVELRIGVPPILTGLPESALEEVFLGWSTERVPCRPEDQSGRVSAQGLQTRLWVFQINSSGISMTTKRDARD